MSRLMKTMLLLFLAFPAWAETPGRMPLGRSCVETHDNAACIARLPQYSSPQAAAVNSPLSTGSSIGIASSTSETSVANTIPHMVANGSSLGSGSHQATVSLTGPGTAAVGGYTQSVADVKTRLFHLGYMTRFTTDSTSRVKDYSWATATSKGNGQTTLKATSSAISATSASVSAGGITAASSGRAISAATSSAAFSGPGTAAVSATAWSNSASHAQIVLNRNTPVSSSASTINQSGGHSQASISNLSATQARLNANLVSKGTGIANMTGLGSSATNRSGSVGRTTGLPTTVPTGVVTQAAIHPSALSAGPVTQIILSGKSAPAGMSTIAKGK